MKAGILPMFKHVEVLANACFELTQIMFKHEYKLELKKKKVK